MKIVVFADLHGNITAAERAVRLSFDEKADKTVFCGDIFGVWGSAQEIAEKLQQVCGIAYFVRGNNDFSCYDGYIAGGLEEYAVMYHFGRTLFFTHGDRYNGGRVPPVLKQGTCWCTDTPTLQTSLSETDFLCLTSVHLPVPGTESLPILFWTTTAQPQKTSKEMYSLF